MSIVTVMLLTLGMATPPKAEPATPPTLSCVMPADADLVPVSPDLPGSHEMMSRTVGPFGSYAAAADYADYLEIELGYLTRVVRSTNGWYYVIYW